MQRRDVLLSAIAAATLGVASRGRAAGAASAALMSRSLPAVRTRDGGGLFVRDWGEGRPVLFVHSWAMSSPMIRAPMSVPSTLPRPPNRFVPPRMVAVMAVSS